jgi:uncharacterized lipoprotein YddW (UPF0748 family)
MGIFIANAIKDKNLIMKNTIALLFFGLIIAAVEAQTSPKRELRGAWIATYANIDWPASGSSSSVEQSTFIQRVDEHKATGMNAIFVQVRSQCDALFPNPYEPWSADLTGNPQGTAPNPYYDPLQFMINETKQRGMEFHAWFNPYRAMATFNNTNFNNLSAQHVVKAHPEWIMNVTPIGVGSQQRLLNPGAPEVWAHIIKVVMHVVRNYDVDGIHFDDYFYTNPSLTTYNDDSVYNIHNRGIADRGNWRRSNVDTLIRRLGDSIRSVKPWIKFGISPSGIWRSQSLDPLGSNTSSGASQHYKDVFANSRLWLQQGWIDYLAPQVYWYIGQTGSDYNNLTPWWSNNSFGRHIYMGMAGYKVGDAGQNAAFATDNTQIPRQIRLNRQNAGVSGAIVYNTTSLRNNRLAFRDSLTQYYFNKPVLLPAMTWKDNSGPAAATSLSAVLQPSNSILLSWTNPAATSVETDKAKQFAIYRANGAAPDISNADQLIAVTNTDVDNFTDNEMLPNGSWYYVVTALDRLHNESAASNTASIVLGPLPLTLVHFKAKKLKNSEVALEWKTSNEINTAHFDIERAFNSPDVFNKISSEPANSGSSQFLYQFSDRNVGNAGNYYYRLKMVDKDGAFTYSEIRKVAIEAQQQDIFVYPVPVATAGQLKIEWPGTEGFQYYKLVSMDGQVLMQSKLLFNNGLANLQLHTNIKAGTYVLQFFAAKAPHNLAILIQ